MDKERTVIERKIGERIIIGDNVVIEIVGANSQRARIGIQAPASVLINRMEIHSARMKELEAEKVSWERLLHEQRNQEK